MACDSAVQFPVIRVYHTRKKDAETVRVTVSELTSAIYADVHGKIDGSFDR